MSTSYHDTLVKAARPGALPRLINFADGHLSPIPIEILANIFLHPTLTDFAVIQGDSKVDIMPSFIFKYWTIDSNLPCQSCHHHCIDDQTCHCTQVFHNGRRLQGSCRPCKCHMGQPGDSCKISSGRSNRHSHYRWDRGCKLARCSLLFLYSVFKSFEDDAA